MPYAHHILVHFPIALGLLAAACAALAGVRPSPSHDEAARFIGYLAAVAAVFASVAGLLDVDALRKQVAGRHTPLMTGMPPGHKM